MVRRDVGGSASGVSAWGQQQQPIESGDVDGSGNGEEEEVAGKGKRKGNKGKKVLVAWG
jgi:hypothetical protein